MGVRHLELSNQGGENSARKFRDTGQHGDHQHKNNSSRDPCISKFSATAEAGVLSSELVTENGCYDDFHPKSVSYNSLSDDSEA